MAEGIVDFLETVEVDQQHPGVPAGALLREQRRIQAFEESPSVRQAGQVVGAGVLVVGRRLTHLAQCHCHAS